jgi:GT2 family glycosyltransferase
MTIITVNAASADWVTKGNSGRQSPERMPEVFGAVRKKPPPASQQTLRRANVGVVAIGRNEGERLRKCLSSVRHEAALIVCVDSGSTDGSVAIARSAGCDVVALDMKIQFSAARARNAGNDRLRQLVSDLRYVQFVDGDCEIVPGWINSAATYLETHDDVAIVCGRLRERFPERSVYNWLCDQEWDGPAGEVRACGGNAMMRASALEAVGGFRDDLIAGEEPELCVRLRAAGWRIWRLDAEMALHDAAMTHFGQWWRRGIRSGYAYAQGAYLHGAPPERHYVWETRRAWLLGVWLPLACLAAGLAFGPWRWAAWMIYPLHMLQKVIRGSGSLGVRLRLALFYVLASFPQSWGGIMFMRDRLLGREAHLIEHK